MKILITAINSWNGSRRFIPAIGSIAQTYVCHQLNGFSFHHQLFAAGMTLHIFWFKPLKPFFGI
jgi:hypothetical protein